MPQLKVGIALEAFDRASGPLAALSRSAGSTKAALAKLGDQASAMGKLGGLQSSLGKLGGKLDISRRKTSELGRALKSTEIPTRKMRQEFERSQRQTARLARAHKTQKEELRELSASLRKAGIDTRGLSAEQERLERASGRLSRRLARQKRASAGSASRRGLGIGGSFLAGLAGSGAFFGIDRAVRSAGGFVAAAAQGETLETTLRTIEGSSKKAQKSMGWIDRFTASTPFQLDQVSEAFIRLRAYGMDPQASLRTLGDTASAMGKDVMQAVEAIADAVTGENERLKEFGIKARTKGDTITYEYTLDGETRTAIADARDRAQIQRTLLGIWENRFGGAMGDRMGTFDGMVSNLSDHWLRFQRMVMDSGPFEMLKDRLRGVLGTVSEMDASGELDALAAEWGGSFAEAFEKFESDVWPVLRDDVWPALKDIGDAIGGILEMVNATVEAFGGWGVALKALFAYQAARLGGGILQWGGGKLSRGADVARSAWDFGGVVRDAWRSPGARRTRRRAGRGAGRLRGAIGSLAAGLAPDLGDSLASPHRRRMRGRFGKLRGGLSAATSGALGKLRGGFGAAKAGAGKAAGGIASLGRTFSQLALRFAPLAMGALKAVGAAIAGVSLPVAATAAAIAGAAYLIWKHWEPIKKFFADLWEGVKSAFAGAWETLSSIDWSGLGARLMGTLAEGIRSAPGAVWNALKGGLGKLADLLPSSDARTGPLSRLSDSGAAILATMGDGVRRSGPGLLQRPLSRALGTAAAGLALSIPATPAFRPVPPDVPGFAREAPDRRGETPGQPPAPAQAGSEAAPLRDVLDKLGGLLPSADARPPRPFGGPLPAVPGGLPLSAPEAPEAPDRRGESPSRPAFEERFSAAARPGPPAAAPAPPAAPRFPQRPPATVHHHYRIRVEIRQLPGEDAGALARRVARELERRQALAAREALGDAY